MNQKKAKELRRNAKAVYPGETTYHDVFYKIEEYLTDPLTGVKTPNPAYFMDGSLARRTMNDGSTRKMFQDMKRGVKSVLVEFKPSKLRYYKCRGIV